MTTTALPPHTTVLSNGWPAGYFSIDDLIVLLGNYQLEVNANRIDHEGRGTFCFSGNFKKLSHVFQIRSSDAETVDALATAMVLNRRRADYRADAAFRESAHKEYISTLAMTGKPDALKEAQAEWAAVRPALDTKVHGAPVDARTLPKVLVSNNATPAPRRAARP